MRLLLQIASEALKGRVFEVSLADLQKVGFCIQYIFGILLCLHTYHKAGCTPA